MRPFLDQGSEAFQLHTHGPEFVRYFMHVHTNAGTPAFERFQTSGVLAHTKHHMEQKDGNRDDSPG